MTRKDYQVIAEVLSLTTRHVMPNEDWAYMVLRFGNTFAADNDRFDRDKWYDACNIDYTTRGN